MPKTQVLPQKNRKSAKKSKSDAVESYGPTPKIPRNIFHSTTFQKGIVLLSLALWPYSQTILQWDS